MHILLVDDCEADAELIRATLRRSDARLEMTHVWDGVEALDYLTQRAESPAPTDPVVILLDLNMPRMDGLTLLKLIRSDPHLQEIPVVILTTSDSDVDVTASYRSRCNAYVVKPTDLEGFEGLMKTIRDFWCTHNRRPMTQCSMPSSPTPR